LTYYSFGSKLIPTKYSLKKNVASKKYYLTPEGLQKLKEELEHLTSDRRQEIIERIQEAVAHGDLSENADYAQAKEEQAFVEGRIAEIEDIIRNAELIQPSDSDSVDIGSTVRVAIDGKEYSYTIVGSNEANPREGKISNESLVGRSLLGRKKGDKVDVQTPSGTKAYTILEVS
jgi:transcription elongation factor GreA